MASTSTGLQPVGIARWMASSTGAFEEFSSGSKLNMKVNSEIEMESGSTFNMESGAVLNVRAGAAIKVASSGAISVPVTMHTSLIKAIPAYGMSVVSAATTGKAEKVVFTIKKPAVGNVLHIVQGCTFAQIIRGSSAAKTIFFGTTMRQLVTLAKTTKGVGRGGFTLVAASSGKWMPVGASTAGINAVTFSTACT